jgi:hypothetical protein
MPNNANLCDFDPLILEEKFYKPIEEKKPKLLIHYDPYERDRVLKDLQDAVRLMREELFS